MWTAPKNKFWPNFHRYIDQGRNPQLYTKECLERALAKNEQVKGKIDTMTVRAAQQWPSYLLSPPPFLLAHLLLTTIFVFSNYRNSRAFWSPSWEKYFQKRWPSIKPYMVTTLPLSDPHTVNFDPGPCPLAQSQSGLLRSEIDMFAWIKWELLCHWWIS